MKIDLFNEIQNPRPWPEGHEQVRFTQALEQAVLADELGYGCWWQVEHHGAGEFSLSSAPELMLAANQRQVLLQADIFDHIDLPSLGKA